MEEAHWEDHHHLDQQEREKGCTMARAGPQLQQQQQQQHGMAVPPSGNFLLCAVDLLHPAQKENSHQCTDTSNIHAICPHRMNTSVSVSDSSEVGDREIAEGSFSLHLFLPITSRRMDERRREIYRRLLLYRTAEDRVVVDQQGWMLCAFPTWAMQRTGTRGNT